jgi:DNA ligase-1
MFKPMLACELEDPTKLKFPVLVSPKLDGFRAIVIDGVVMSRNLKPIRNKHVQRLYGRPEFNGFDGELIVGDPTAKDCFNKTSSGVTRADGEPDVKYYVFDNYLATGNWYERFTCLVTLANVVAYDRMIDVPHILVYRAEDLLAEEERFLNKGYEGLMIRALNSPYKQGRSTTNEGYLLKLKRFEDSEGLVLGMEERMHNANEATVNALGHTQRTSHQENLVPTNTMGALIVRDLKTGVEFNIGTGFDDSTRDWWWNLIQSTVGVETLLNNGGREYRWIEPDIIVKYKHFAVGAKDKPRFPAYLGIRDKDDL